MQNTLTEDRGQDLFQTSTHTAHHWRPGYYFPSPNFRVKNNDFLIYYNHKYINSLCYWHSRWQMIHYRRASTSRIKSDLKFDSKRQQERFTIINTRFRRATMVRLPWSKLNPCLAIRLTICMMSSKKWANKLLKYIISTAIIVNY